MENSIQEQLNKQQEMLEKIYSSTEKTRKYILGTIIFSIITFLLPLIALLILLPSMINKMTNITGF